jgi:methionyl-tRNA synthetase
MKYYLTTPIYYVNDSPHIGHAYTTIAADVLARWRRLNGDDVYFLTGTDEHGAKIAQAAKAKNTTPESLTNEMSAAFKAAWQALNISNDGFIRTTQERHIKGVQKFLQTLYDKGLIYKKNYEGLYCIGCEKFIAEKDLDEQKCCHDHKTKPVLQAEENYFFKLSQFEQELTKRITAGDVVIEPEGRRNEILGKLKLGLEDISISRSGLSWGIPLPFDNTQTVYVWVDALINYVTGLGYGSEDETSFEKFWPADVHLMAKDILWFHSVIWPALLLGAGLTLPKKVYAHGFFTINGDKMSKTIGNVIAPAELIEKFGVDGARYLTISLIPFGPDGDISWEALSQKYNLDLANNLGNLVSRTIKMAEKYFEGKVPEPQNVDLTLTDNVTVLLKQQSFYENLNNLLFHKAAETIMNALTVINQQIETDAPWKLAKDETKAEKLAQCMFGYFNAIAVTIMHLIPFMPDTCEKIWHSFGISAELTQTAKNYFAGKALPVLWSGNSLKSNGIMFPRIENNLK